MGVVYAGRHAGDGTPVAVKTVTGRDAARFAQIRREIRALARLDHPGVVRILDQGVDQGRPWYAMQHLQGVTLRDLVVGQSDQVSSLGSFHAATTLIFDPEADGPATPAIAEAVPAGDGAPVPYGTRAPLLAILQRVCDALAYVHGEGVIHRDIKLSNIFIVDNGLPVLVDFGLAEDMGGAVGREWIDHAQRISGSPAYMSPEQIRGEILDARTDLYSLGCVLYQILTGRPPFIGSRRTIIRSQLERHAPPPGALTDGIPEVLDRLVLRLLEKDRDRRIGYAESVAAAISGLVTEPLRWPGTLPAPKPYLYRSAFVGRRDLLVVVNGCIRRCRAGEGSILAIAGESGAGKTRLAMEVGVMARRAGLDVISADCLPRIEDANRGASSQSPPLFVLRPLIDAVIDRCVEAGGGGTRPAAGAVGCGSRGLLSGPARRSRHHRSGSAAAQRGSAPAPVRGPDGDLGRLCRKSSPASGAGRSAMGRRTDPGFPQPFPDRPFKAGAGSGSGDLPVRGTDTRAR